MLIRRKPRVAMDSNVIKQQNNSITCLHTDRVVPSKCLEDSAIQICLKTVT